MMVSACRGVVWACLFRLFNDEVTVCGVDLSSLPHRLSYEIGLGLGLIDTSFYRDMWYISLFVDYHLLGYESSGSYPLIQWLGRSATVASIAVLLESQDFDGVCVKPSTKNSVALPAFVNSFLVRHQYLCPSVSPGKQFLLTLN